MAMSKLGTVVALSKKIEASTIRHDLLDRYYEQYVEKFNALLDQLIAEPNPYEQKLASN